MERFPAQPADPEHRGRHAADDQSQEAHIERYVDGFGNAFRAFLTLPDVDPADPGIFDLFDDSYLGTCSQDREEVLANLTEFTSVQSRIRQIAADAGWPAEAVHIDLDILWNLTREVLFDIVDYENEFHVFGK